MILVKDNFLDDATFEWLHAKASDIASKSYQYANRRSNRELSKFYINDQTAWDYKYGTGDLKTVSCLMGKSFLTVHDKIISESKLNNITLMPCQNTFFMFSKSGYKVNRHLDKNYLHTTSEELSKIYKAFIFCHKTWHDDWGGELCFMGSKNLPLSNRLLIYSLDERHWVEEVSDIGENIRMIFGLRFGDETEL